MIMMMITNTFSKIKIWFQTRYGNKNIGKAETTALHMLILFNVAKCLFGVHFSLRDGMRTTSM